MNRYSTADLDNLFLKREGKRMRCSSYDPTGGNDDYLVIPVGESRVFAELEGPAIVTHFSCTIGNENRKHPETGIGHEKFNVRKVLLKIYWDDETTPSVLAPLGDFFGIGHGITKNFVSAPLQMMPQDGSGFSCWFPMPFGKKARFEVVNECRSKLSFYFYIDYEAIAALPENTLYFHALWKRECPTDGIPASERSSHKEWVLGGKQDKHPSAEGNYVLLDAVGSGQYVGCNINIHNLEPSATWDWFGEGDDMIFIDGETWPPRLHGTALEDYLGLAWCPTQEYCAPYQGCSLAGNEMYKGKTTYYRFHIQDPIMFDKSIKVTLEHGHANLRSDDWSSTAYWYQTEPHKAFPEILPVEKRLPVMDKVLWWTGEVVYEENEEIIE